MSSLPRQLNNPSHLGSLSPSNPHESRLSQRPTSDPNDSETITQESLSIWRINVCKPPPVQDEQTDL